MATNSDIKDLFSKYVMIEHEIKLLQDDRKQLLSEFKDRIDSNAFKSALRAARIKSKVKPQERDDFDSVLDILEKEMCIDHLD